MKNRDTHFAIDTMRATGALRPAHVGIIVTTGHLTSSLLMHEIYLHDLTVTKADIDRVGHVNNRAYLKWMEEAAVAHSSANDWPPERYDQTGLGWVAKSHFIEYLKPAFLDDAILVRTWVGGFKRASSIRRYRIERPADNVVLATAETNWAFVNLKTLLPARIPPEVADCFTAVDPDP